MSAFFYKGNSMYRVFRNGDELFTEKIPFAELQPGDIICFRTPQTEAVVHRILRRTEAQVTTQGDNNPRPDDPVDAEHYIGRVTSFRRGKITMLAVNGRKGMRRFRINQLKRRLRAWVFELGRKNKGFFELAPLRFCAGVFPPVLARFGEQTLAMRGKLIVAEKLSGKPWHVRGVWKAIYPPALLESLAEKMDLTNRTTLMEELPAMKQQTALDNAVAAIKDGHYRLGTAESCTGGGIGALITALPGSSDFFVGGIIAYANRIKHDVLGVSNQLLETRGAVSAECAEAMAEGAASLLHADVTVAVTGIAGPGGGSPEKPVGLVYIAARSPQRSIVRKFQFTGNREEVREKTQTSALKLICELLSE